MADPTVVVLVGTKAQYIKTAPVLREMTSRGVPYRLIYTGQHSETFEELEAAFDTRPPDDVLVPCFEAATHSSFLVWTLRFWIAVAARLLRRDWRQGRVGLVHGDTASTLFGAIALRIAGVRVGHVEAGLRSTRLLEPFPEELIRRGVSRLSCWHYVPDDIAAGNLRHARGEVIHTGGNTLQDALAMALGSMDAVPEHGGVGGYAVVSMHRSENLSRRRVLDMILEEVVEAASTLPIRFVLHPATREGLKSNGWLTRLQQTAGVTLLARMDYPEFVRLLIGSRFLMTDGGSNQEEAAMLGLPTLLLRRATERPDGLDRNVEISGLDPEAIRNFVSRHAGGGWRLRLLETTPPSAVIVTHLERLVSA